MTVAWDPVTRDHVVRAVEEYDRLGPEKFFAAHGYAPTTTYDLVWDNRRYPPKAILGTAYEFATGNRLASGDFEGGKSGAVKVLGHLGFTVEPREASLRFERKVKPCPSVRSSSSTSTRPCSTLTRSVRSLTGPSTTPPRCGCGSPT